MSTAHQSTPFLNIIDGMNTDIKVPHDDEDFNPEQQVCCEELVNCLVYLLRIRTTARALHKVFCPELASILQCISNIFLPATRKITDTAEISIVIQVTDVPLQPLFHQIEARKQHLCVMNRGVHKESSVLTPLGVHEEVRE